MRRAAPHCRELQTRPARRLACLRGEKFSEESFPQNGDEFSTCGNRLLMNFSDVLNTPKTGLNRPEFFFEEMY